MPEYDEPTGRQWPGPPLVMPAPMTIYQRQAFYGAVISEDAKPEELNAVYVDLGIRLAELSQPK